MGVSETETDVAPPYVLGLLLKPKQNPLEIGNHVISHIEPNGLADAAGMRANSRIIKLNDITCEDKTHEFILFFLNYLLRKNSCDTIEITVSEPQSLLSSESDSHRHSQITHTKEQNTVHFQDSTFPDFNKYHQYHHANSSHVDSGISSSTNVVVSPNVTPVHQPPSSDNIRSIIKEIIEVAKHKVVQTPTVVRPATSIAPNSITHSQPIHSSTYTHRPPSIVDETSSAATTLVHSHQPPQRVEVKPEPMSATTTSYEKSNNLKNIIQEMIHTPERPSQTQQPKVEPGPVVTKPTGIIHNAPNLYQNDRDHEGIWVPPSESSTSQSATYHTATGNTTTSYSYSSSSVSHLKAIAQEAIQSNQRLNQYDDPFRLESSLSTTTSTNQITYTENRDPNALANLKAIAQQAILANQCYEEPTNWRETPSVPSSPQSSNRYTTEDPAMLANLKAIAQQAILANQRYEEPIMTPPSPSTIRYTTDDPDTIAHLKAIAEQALLNSN